MNGNNNQEDNPWKALAVIGVIGIDLAISLLVGLWLGKKIDNWLNTGPIFMIIGMFIGFAVGIFSVINLIKPFLSRR